MDSEKFFSLLIIFISMSQIKMEKRIEKLEAELKDLKKDIDWYTKLCISRTDLRHADTIFNPSGSRFIFYDLDIVSSKANSLIDFVAKNRDDKEAIVEKVTEFANFSQRECIKMQILFAIRMFVFEIVDKNFYGVEKRLHQLPFRIEKLVENTKKNNRHRKITSNLDFIKETIEPIDRHWKRRRLKIE